MSNWSLPSEITLFKRKLLRRLKWINMVRPNVAVRKIVLDHEGLPGRSRMPTEREDFLPIETTVEELEEVIRTPDIEESLMLKDDHGVNILPLLTLQSMLRDRPPVTHDIWEDALQRLDKLLAGGRQGGADWCRKHRVFEIFCVVMIARQKCKDDLTVLNNITSYASVRLNQFNLFNTLKSVEIEVELLTTPGCPLTQYTQQDFMIACGVDLDTDFIVACIKLELNVDGTYHAEMRFNLIEALKGTHQKHDARQTADGAQILQDQHQPKLNVQPDLAASDTEQGLVVGVANPWHKKHADAESQKRDLAWKMQLANPAMLKLTPILLGSKSRPAGGQGGVKVVVAIVSVVFVFIRVGFERSARGEERLVLRMRTRPARTPRGTSRRWGSRREPGQDLVDPCGLLKCDLGLIQSLFEPDADHNDADSE
ncbi:hypothetical protein HG531_002736 [Fusarium graminearum]|nr:hypothetical protein HG531_002736 [Fusarium graminearum]